MYGNGKDGNNWGKSRRRGREADSRRSQGQESGPERSGGRPQGARQGSRGSREHRADAGREGPAKKRGGWAPGFLFRNLEKGLPPYARPKWTAPQVSTEPIPHPLCPYCGKAIKDMAAAMTDKASGQPVHFDCVAARIAEGETLESGDAVVYIGGGRFGIVHFPGMIRNALQGRKNGEDYDTRNFRIKKIFEWENKEDRAPWRKNIEEHYSVV